MDISYQLLVFMTRNSTSLPQLIKSGFEYHASSLNIKVTFSNGADFLTFRLRAEVTIIFFQSLYFPTPLVSRLIYITFRVSD